MEKYRKEYNIDTDDRIDFYKGYSPMMLHYSRINNHGPLAWIALVLKDPFSKTIMRRIINFKKNPASSAPYAQGPDDVKVTSDKDFRVRIVESSGMADVAPYGSKKDDPVSNASTPLPLSISKKDAESVTVSRVLDVLPPKKVIWLLVDRFFKYIYPFLPYLDEPKFISELTRIVGPRSIAEEKVTELHMDKRLDFAIVGSLLIVLRTAYLSLLSNNESSSDFPPKTAEEQYLLDNAVPRECINVAQLCLNQFKLLRRCALSIFQCAMLMRDYQKVDGSDALSDGDSQIFTGMLIQMGISIGLNRDPSKFDLSVSTSRLGSVWRKIWYRLVSEDNYQALQMGSPKLIREDLYDTELPIYSKGNSNNEDDELEEASIRSMKERFELERIMNVASQQILDIKTAPSVGQVLKALEDVEVHLKSRWPSLQSIMTPTTGDHVDNVLKTKAIISYCETISFLHPAYYHIFLYYQSKQNITASVKLSAKCMSLAMEIISNFSELIMNSHRYVGKGFDFILTPMLEISVHKSLQIRITMFLRICAFEEKLKAQNADPEVINELEAINKLWVEFGDTYLKALSLVATRDFYAWRMLKAHSFIWKALEEGVDMTSNENKDIFNFIEKISPEERRQLFSLMKEENYRAAPKPKVPTTEESVTSPAQMNSWMVNQDLDKFWVETVLNKTAGEPGSFETERMFDGVSDFEDALLSDLDMNLNGFGISMDGKGATDKDSLVGHAIFDVL